MESKANSHVDHHAEVALPPPVTADELIDDRALASADEDAFRLQDFVTDLAQLCRVTETPANVALYGAWGSGKTSLGNLLRDEFQEDPDIAFGRFDAMKYAEVPLRRHFLSNVAASFKIKDSAFSTGLYESRKRQNVRMDLKSVVEFFGALVASVVILVLVMAAAALAITLIGTRSLHGAAVGATLRASAPGIMLAAPIVGAVLIIAFRRFEVEVTTNGPSTDEEFERLFRKLVKAIKKKTGKRRIVLFIDELDRCSPKQVGSALETLRTFLDVPSCVFVVAADQQVLEHALTEGGARQATPADRTNPYYSSGSAYLDKIFHYQRSLPPLLPRRLSQYALNLIAARDGIWKAVPNSGELVSVLVPTHVRSPRRVKTLLNAFAAEYRLAMRRAADGALDGRVHMRASELAKLVVLRTEFPLFARDLTLDARMPDLVLRLSETGEPYDEVKADFPGVTAAAFEKAQGYAEHTLPVADLLITADSQAADASTSAAEASAADTDAARIGSADVQQTYAQQLIRYLQRTRSIPSPKRDLVYLDSSGAALGLPAELADRIETDATDGRVDEVSQQIRGLSGPDQLTALSLIGRLIVEESVGLESANRVHALLASTRVVEADLAPVADELTSAIWNYRLDYELQSSDLAAALRLSLASEAPSARALRRHVLARPEVLTDRDLGMTALRHASVLGSRNDQRLSEVLAMRVVDMSSPEIVHALADLDDARVARLVESISPAAVAEEEGDSADAADADSAEKQRDESLASGLRELATAFADAGRGGEALAAFDKLLALNTPAGRNEALGVIDTFKPITDPTRGGAVVRAAAKRYHRQWPRWLGSLERGLLIADADPGQEIVTSAIARLWKYRFPEASATAPATDDEFAVAAASLAAACSALPVGMSGVEALLVPQQVSSTAEITSRSECYAALRVIAQVGLIDTGGASRLILADMQHAMSINVPTVPQAALTEWAIETAMASLPDVQPSDIEAFATAAQASSWLDAPGQSVMSLVTSAALHRHDPSVQSPLSSAEVAKLLADDEFGAEPAAVMWLTDFQPGAADVVEALQAQAEAGQLGDSVRQALSSLADVWGPVEKTGLLERLAGPHVNGLASDALLRELRVAGADSDRAAELLCELFKGSTNNEQRGRVLRLWRLSCPSSNKARRLLMDEIVIPLIRGGKGQLQLALDYFELVANAGKPTQQRIQNALSGAIGGDKELGARVSKVLQDAGWIKRAKKWRVI